MKWVNKKVGGRTYRVPGKPWEEMNEAERLACLWGEGKDHQQKRGLGKLFLELGFCGLVGLAGGYLISAVTAPERELKISPEEAQRHGIVLGPEVMDEIKESIREARQDNTQNQEITDIIFYLDPGHGGAKGENVGTTILGSRIPERDYVLDVGNNVADMLRAMGYAATEQTRTGIDPNLRLGDRLARFERDERNIGVSLHVNGCGDSSVSGVRVYHNPTGRGVAGHVAERLRPIFGSARTIPHTGYRVLRGGNPAVLVELGFGGSNPQDAGILTARQGDISSAIAAALADYHADVAEGHTDRGF
jgi:N-acetylmuramoyl-L-alanine amidase